MHYRYFVCYFLDSNLNGVADRQMIIARWETILKPRQISMPCDITHDTFGSYGSCLSLTLSSSYYRTLDGDSLVNDGWLLDARQTEIRLRLHDDALTFYKSRYRERVYRIKVTPIDVRFVEVSDDDVGQFLFLQTKMRRIIACLLPLLLLPYIL